MPMDARVVLGIPLYTRNIPDFWCWHFEKHGSFTVKSAYKMLVATKQRREAWLEGTSGSSSSNAEEKSWKTLWKTSVPAKVRMFLWRLSKHSLPTNDVRMHHHMTDTASCGLCGTPDSWRHSLMDCAASRCSWALNDSEVLQRMTEVSEPSAKQWLFTLMESMSQKEFTLLAVTLWAIWSARQKAIHEGIFHSPHSTHAFITRFISDLEIVGDSKLHTVQGPISHVAPRPGRPKAPPMGYAKIHVDAGVRFERGGSAVAICRDEQGVYLGSSALVIYGVCDPAALEVIACREALALAEDLNLQQFIVASDCKQVVSDISKGARGRYGAIISEINLKAATFNCKFGFEGRAANYEAHKLAKFALSQGPGRHVWYGNPHDPSCIPLRVDFGDE